MNYSSLLATVATRLNRNDLDALIPDFVDRAEAAIRRRLALDPVRPMAAIATSTTSADSFALPDDFVDAISLSASDGTSGWVMNRIALADLSNADWMAANTQAYAQQANGKVQHYYIAGDAGYLSAIPDTSLTLTLAYYGKLQSLAAGTQSNWLLADHPDVYEFGTLAWAAKHLRDDEMAAANMDLFMAALEAVVAAYPDTVNPTELRATDAPWSTPRWSVLNG